MNYKLLLQRLTVRQFNAMADAWYNRLNNLKHWYANNQGDYKAYKSEQLIIEMIGRMMAVSKIYMQINQHSTPPKFAQGGIFSVNEKGKEEIIIPKR